MSFLDKIFGTDGRKHKDEGVWSWVKSSSRRKAKTFSLRDQRGRTIPLPHSTSFSSEYHRPPSVAPSIQSNSHSRQRARSEFTLPPSRAPSSFSTQSASSASASSTLASPALSERTVQDQRHQRRRSDASLASINTLSLSYDPTEMEKDQLREYVTAQMGRDRNAPPGPRRSVSEGPVHPFHDRPGQAKHWSKQQRWSEGAQGRSWWYE